MSPQLTDQLHDSSQWTELYKVFKIKVVAVMLFSALVGMLITPHSLRTANQVIFGLTGIGLAACGSAALNHRFDMDEDKKMRRTKKRPLAVAKITPELVEKTAYLVIVMSMAILISANNLLSAGLTLATTVGYSIIYTKWLKPSTPQNIVIGGLSGAMPPLLGWTCITGDIAVQPLLLVLIIFTWTPAHFWPLALEHSNDYAKTKWPMLPITHGKQFTHLSIIAYALLTAATSLLPFCIRMAGYRYLAVVCILNARWLFLCYQLWLKGNRSYAVFRFSIWYILGLFLILLIDQSP